MKVVSEAREKAASAELKQAQTFKTLQDAMKVAQDRMLEPERLAMEAENAERNASIAEMKAKQPRAAA